MKIVLKKIRKSTPFTWINPIKVEPLELEYLKAVIDDLELEHRLNLECIIVDALYHEGLVHGERLHKTLEATDIVILNGYNTARTQMILEARQIKEMSPKTLVIGSGVDVQINWKLYEDSDFDYLVVSNKLSDFKDLMMHILLNKEVMLGARLSIEDRMSLNDRLPPKDSYELRDNRLVDAIEPLKTFESLEPSRTYFDQIKTQTRYLLYDNVALVKRSHGCPYKCEFCFCKQLNQGHFVSRSYDTLRLEMASVKADHYWVVDDVFIHNEVEANAFIKAFENTSFKMIVYLRADFVVTHFEIMQKLKETGIVEVIIGFESIKASFLEDFSKGYAPDINTKAITVLKKIGLSFTALFMVDISDDHKDFKALKSYIRQHQIQNYTFSIFTPLRGTDLYEHYKEDITDFKCEHYDFLHLVLEPLKMSAFAFKFAFMRLYVFQFFHSKMARQVIYKLLKDSFKKRL